MTEQGTSQEAFSGAEARRWWTLVLVIAAAALAMRVFRLGQVHFGIDEAIASSLATQIAYGYAFPLVGIRTSFGFLNPPTFVYLLAPFFRLTRDPQAVALVMAAAGSLAVPLAALSARWMAGLRAGLFAAAIVAFCPNAVEHSRRLWGHDLQVVLSAVACWGAVLSARQARAWPLALSFSAAALAQSCHLSGVLLWIPGLVVGCTMPRRLAKGLAAGLAVAALIYLPWMVHQAREGWPDLAIIAGTLSGGGAARDLGHPVAPLAAWCLVLGDFWSHDLLGAERPFMVAPFSGLMVSLLALALMFVALAGACINLYRRLSNATERALLATVLASALLFALLLRASVPPYHLPALVPTALLAAVALSRWAAGRWLISIYTAAAVVLVLSVSNAVASGRGTSIPLAEKQQLVTLIAEEAAGSPFRLMQEARHPETGIDVAWIYLFYAAGIEKQHTVRTPRRLFVVHDRSMPLHPAARAFLGPVEFADPVAGRLELHEVPAEQWDRWLDLCRSASQRR